MEIELLIVVCVVLILLVVSKVIVDRKNILKIYGKNG